MLIVRLVAIRLAVVSFGSARLMCGRACALCADCITYCLATYRCGVLLVVAMVVRLCL